MTEENITTTIETSGTIASPATSSIFDNLALLFTYTELSGKLYVDKENNARLFKNDIELTKDIIAKFAYMYDDKFWSYKDYENNIHLYNNDVEMTKNIKTSGIMQHPQTSQWFYANEKNKLVPL